MNLEKIKSYYRCDKIKVVRNFRGNNIIYGLWNDDPITGELCEQWELLGEKDRIEQRIKSWEETYRPSQDDNCLN